MSVVEPLAPPPLPWGKRLFRRLLALAESRWALPALAATAFAEASFFPLPPDALLAPMALARPRRAWLFILVATVASVVGGMLGYAIGVALADTVGAWILRAYGGNNAYQAFQDEFAHWGKWIILIKGLTPIPYKLVTIASGIARFDFLTFVWCSIVTRGLRFALVGGLIAWKGELARDFIERRLIWVTGGLLLLAIAGIAAVKVLM